MFIQPGRSLGIIFIVCLMACNAYAQTAAEHYSNANALITSGKYDEALAQLNQAIAKDPKVADYFTLRGELYRNKNDCVNAIADYSKSIELNPNNGEVYYLRAICYYFTKEYDKAWDDVRKAQSLGVEIRPGFIQDLQDASGQSKTFF